MYNWAIPLNLSTSVALLLWTFLKATPAVRRWRYPWSYQSQRRREGILRHRPLDLPRHRLGSLRPRTSPPPLPPRPDLGPRWYPQSRRRRRAARAHRILCPEARSLRRRLRRPRRRGLPNQGEEVAGVAAGAVAAAGSVPELAGQFAVRAVFAAVPGRDTIRQGLGVDRECG